MGIHRSKLHTLLAAVVLVGLASAGAALLAPLGRLTAAAWPVYAAEAPNLAPVRASAPAIALAPALNAAPRDVPRHLLAAVLTLAADQAGVPASELALLRAEATTWPDTALGCPQLGLAYSTTPTGGFWIVVAAHGELLDYRAAPGGIYRRCLPL